MSAIHLGPMRFAGARWFALIVILLTARAVRAEDGYELWLRYRLEPDPARREEYRSHAAAVVIAHESEILRFAQAELVRGLMAITGEAPRQGATGEDGAIYLGARQPDEAAAESRLGAEGYAIHEVVLKGRPSVVISGTDLGVLHGTFALLRHLQLGQPLAKLEMTSVPRIPLRMADHWDNPVRTAGFRDESIERGYAGDSFFRWDELPQRVDPRLRDWARLLAAMNVNGVMINNVNTAKRGLEGWRLLTTPWVPKLAAMAAVLRPAGVRLFVSVNFFSPVLIDHLPTADPLDPAVRAWWKAKADEIYAAIPDFGGFLVKADSEGEPGPLKYGRTHADGANMIAAAVAPHGGTVQWRAFVYDRTTGDRVTQAFTTFAPLDGKFDASVYLQVKNGPLDFQVREPVSTLFGAMPRTRSLLELQITQEYTGQDKHVCFLAPMWREVLHFDGDESGPRPAVAELLRTGGIAGVMNTGDARNWTGHVLAQANTFALARLAWDPDAEPEAIAREWAALTFGRDDEVVRTVARILMDSWPAYEDYTAPIGLGHLTRRGDHFTPDPENRVDYHGADAKGVGFDRTAKTGTGYAAQYPEPWRSRYEDVNTCPDDLLLFFHHVPYTHRLHNGHTVIQEIYDRHFRGVERVKGYLRDWESLQGTIDDERFAHVRARLMAQVGYAEEWCRVINGYFQRLSGIPDERGRSLPSSHGAIRTK